MPHNPFGHIHSAPGSLIPTMERQDQLLSKFTKGMPSVEYLLSIPEKDMDKVCAKLKRQLASLTQNLSRTLPRTRETALLLEENVPLLLAHFQNDPPRVPEMRESLLVGIDAVSKFVYSRAEYVQNFKKAIEVMRDGQGLGLQSESSALLDVLDEMATLYNRHWFILQDIVTDLRARL